MKHSQKDKILLFIGLIVTGAKNKNKVVLLWGIPLPIISPNSIKIQRSSI